MPGSRRALCALWRGCRAMRRVGNCTCRKTCWRSTMSPMSRFSRGRRRPRSRRYAGQVLTEARTHRDAALDLLVACPREARPAFLQLALLDRDLQTLSRVERDPFALYEPPSRLRVLWTLWRASKAKKVWRVGFRPLRPTFADFPRSSDPCRQGPARSSPAFWRWSSHCRAGGTPSAFFVGFCVSGGNRPKLIFIG